MAMRSIMWTFIWTIGHRAKCSSQDCGFDISQETGSFHSPHYPSSYGDNEYCVWRITVATRQHVCVILDDFAGERYYDYLSIYDGGTTSNILKSWTYSLSMGDNSVCSSGNQMTAVWRTDYSVVGRGFSAHFIAVWNNCSSPPSISNGHLATNSSTLYASTIKLQCDSGYVHSDRDFIQCQSNGTWSKAECIRVDCGQWPGITNLSANQTITYLNSTSVGAAVLMTCDAGYHVFNDSSAHTELAICTFNGTWSPRTYPQCLPTDCGLPSPLANGKMVLINNSTTFPSQAEVVCNRGYLLNGTSGIVNCTKDGIWSPDLYSCLPVECPALDYYHKLRVELAPNTTAPIFNTTATFSCSPGTMLVGYSTIKCTTNGQWNGPVPKCVALQKTVSNCLINIDNKDRTWKETQPGTIVVESCPNGYSGEVTRQCSEEGLWLNPFYNCISKRVAELMSAVESIKESPSAEKIMDSLDQLVNITKPANGSSYIGELNAITNMLDTIASVSDVIEVTDEQAHSFFSATSNLLDTDNAESWKSAHNSYENDESTDGAKTSSGAMKVLNVVDKYTDVLMNSLGNNSESSKTIQSGNLVVHVTKVNTTASGLRFPEEPLGIKSSIILPKTSLIGSNSISAVVYKNLTGIISSKLNNDRDSTINSEVVTVTVDNWENNTDFVVDITMEYAEDLHSAPICSFWNISIFAWDTTGCRVLSSEPSSALCRCTHLTNFAVLMSPVIQNNVNTKALDIISIVGCSVSLVGLLVTVIFHIVLWKYVKKRRVAVLLNLSVALIISYAMFIGGIDRTENKIVCTTLASLLHYIYLVVFSLMLVEGIDVALSILVVFKTKSKLKWMLVAAWVVPVVIVGITLGVTKTEGFGNEISCWLTAKGGVIWAFIGPALLVVLVNFVIIVIVIRATLGSYSIAKKSSLDRAKTAIRCLLVLLPLMGFTWVLGVFYLDESMAWVQYAFAVCNSLQGLVIFLFHCAFNKTIIKAYKAKKQRSSYTSSTYLKSRSTSEVSENSTGTVTLHHKISVQSIDAVDGKQHADLPRYQQAQHFAKAATDKHIDMTTEHVKNNAKEEAIESTVEAEYLNKDSSDIVKDNQTDKHLYDNTLL